MTNSRMARLTKPASRRLEGLTKMTGIAKTILIEKALKNYIPYKNDE